MSKHHSVKCIGIFLSLTLLLVDPLPSLGEKFDHRLFSKNHSDEILTITSDEDAASWFLKKFGPKFDIQKSRPSTSKTKTNASPLPQHITHDISQFMANLTVSLLAMQIQNIIQSQDFQELERLVTKKFARFEWILTQPIPPDYSEMLTLSSSIHHLRSYLQPETNDISNYSMLSPEVNEAYSAFFGSEMSWITLSEKQGVDGIHARLNEFLTSPESIISSTSAYDENESNKRIYVNHYLRTRLIPVFTAHLLSKSIQVTTLAEESARESLHRIAQWHEHREETKMHSRLCGKWQWTVHNHQNHQDHKMIMSFLLPTDQPTSQPQPSKIVINGDTVYLRWKFPGGFQEDSLLLSKGDKRLEGTFINSRGPSGSIMGKRLTTCQP